MQQDWFTEEGRSGTLSIEQRDGTWYVASPDKAGETICLLDETVQVEAADEPREVERACWPGFREDHECGPGMWTD